MSAPSLRRRRFCLAARALLLAAPAATAAAQAPDTAALAGVRGEALQQIVDAERKFVALAEAMPAEKYSWRPAAGVRSVSEVYMHMVGANYLIPGMAGVKPAAGVTLTRDMETRVTDKAQVVDMLKKSFAYLRQGVREVPDDQLDAAVRLFGRPATKRGVLVAIATHAHEHLGQSIAYARINGVVPPWSRGPDAAAGGDR
jgi:uncharacterized damage-inducible protein DinB